MVQEPSILTANTYFWAPGSAANQRRRAEERRQAEVAEYFQQLGMEVTRSGNNVIGEHPSGVVAVFSYSESTRNVYKSLTVRKPNGSNSNITLLRKLASGVKVSGIGRAHRYHSQHCNYYL